MKDIKKWYAMMKNFFKTNIAIYGLQSKNMIFQGSFKVEHANVVKSNMSAICD